MAVNWLNEVIKEAKRVGMRVQFSFEPRNKSTNVDETISIIQQIQQQYPLVDAIEMISEESGGWGPSNTAEETKAILTSFFGNEVLNDTSITSYIRPSQSDLGYTYGQMGHFIKVLDVVKAKNIKTVPLKIGIYATTQYCVPAYYLVNKYSPSTEIAILPAHGSANVAKKAPIVVTNESNWSKTTIYSWLEFDGMMYLQQNGIQGIYNLIKNKNSYSPEFRFNTIAFNHWRTAENKVTARYASLSTLYGAIEPSRFYEEYAKRSGIANPEAFASAMQMLQKAFDYNTSNMAFAWMGYWKNGINFQSTESVKGALTLYEAARTELIKCATGNANPYARNTIQFLENRLRATIIYHQAFLKQNELNATGITNEKYEEICGEVLSIYDECMKVYAEMMPDRGCEGTLINMYLSPIRAVKISQQQKTGIPFDEPMKNNFHYDAPAAPIFKGGM
jgi:hypothetical protein